MSLHTVTINIVDFDETTGPAPLPARLEIGRARATRVGNTLVTTKLVDIPIIAGVGTVQLESDQIYRVLFTGIRGFDLPFYIEMPAADTTMAVLWQYYRIRRENIPAAEDTVFVVSDDGSLLILSGTGVTTLDGHLNFSGEGFTVSDGRITFTEFLPQPDPGNGTGSVTVVENNGVLTLSGPGVTELAGVITLDGTDVTESNGVISID